MKTAEEIFDTTIKNYNKQVSQVAWFQFNKRERELFLLMMETYKSQTPGDPWISVETKKPELHKIVLVFYPSYGTEAYQHWQIHRATYETDGEFIDSCFRSQDDITHWMPLPEPPKQ